MIVKRDYLVLLGGDFNSTLDGKLDYVGSKTPVKSRIIDLIKDFFK